MMTRQSKSAEQPTIGVFLGELTAYTDRIWSGIVARSKEKGFNTISFVGKNLNNDPVDKSTSNKIYQLANKNVIDGLIVLTGGIGSLVSTQELIGFCHQFLPLPVVSVGVQIDGVASVRIDNQGGLRNLICHLIDDHQCHRFAAILGPPENEDGQIRFHTLKQVLADHDLALEADLIVPGGFSYQAGQKATEELMQRGIDFDAVVCFNDSIAWGVLNSLQKFGLHVPTDVAVIGFDNIPGSLNTIPPLSTVHQPRRELGEQAFDLIWEYLQGSEFPQHHIMMTEMIVRQSCGCLSPAVQYFESVETFNPDNGIANHQAIPQKKAQQNFVRAYQELFEGKPSKENAITLFDTFSNSLDSGDTIEFLDIFSAILRQGSGYIEEISIWHDMLSILRSHIRTYITGSNTAAYHTECLIQQARILLSDIAQQDQFARRLQSRLQTELVFEINEEVITTFDLPKMMDALKGAIQQLGISFCFLCLNDDPDSLVGSETLPSHSRLIMAYVSGEQLDLSPGGVRFQTEEFLPKEIMPDNERYDLVVLPLRFQDRYLGYVVFEMGYQEGYIYDALRIQISSAVHGASLLDQLSQAQVDLEHRVKERTAELQSEILERGRVEKVLRENEQRFQALFDQTTDAVFLFDLDTQHIMVNQKAADMLGYTLEELLGMGGGDFLAPDETEDAYNKLELALQGKPVPLYERKLVHKDEHLIPVEINLLLVTDSDGNPLHFQSTVRDITQRKQDEQVLKAEIDERIRAERILRENEQRFRALFEQTNDAIIILDFEGRHIAVNNQAADMLGYSVEEFAGLNMKEIIAPNEYPNGQGNLQALLAGKILPIYERTFIHKDGHPVPCEVNAAMVVDSAGQPVHIQSVVRDITKRKRTERILHAFNLASLAMRQANSPGLILSAVGSELRTQGFTCTIFQVSDDLNKLYPLYYNYESRAVATAEKLLNLSAHEFYIKTDSSQIFSKAVYEQQAVFVEDAGQTTRELLPGPLKVFTGQLLRLLKVARSINAPLVVEEKVIGLLSVQSDYLTRDDIPAINAFAHQVAATWHKARLLQNLEESLVEQKRTEVSLRESEEKFRTLFELSPQGIVLIGLNGIILDANQAAVDISGRKKEDTIGQSFLELGWLEEDQLPNYLKLFSRVISGEFIGQIDIRFQIGDDDYRWIKAHPALLKRGNEILALQLIFHEITDNKIAENLIQQRVAELEAIHQTSFKLANASLQVDEIARIAVQQLNSVFSVDASSFSLLNEKDNSLRVIADMWIENEEQQFYDQGEISYLKNYPTTEQVLKSMTPVVIQASDPDADPAELAYMQENDTATLAIIPLAVKSHAIGIIELETWEARLYTPNQLNLAMTLTNQIAVALDNARLFETAQSELHERIQTEKALQESEEQFRSIFENAVMGLYRTTHDGNIIMANPALIRMLGYSSFTELSERNIKVNGYAIDQTRDEFLSLMERDGQVLGFESAWIRKNSSVLYVQENARAIYDEDGNIVYYEGTVEDISARKEVEALQRISEERFNKAFNISPLAMAIQGMNDENSGVWLLINDAFTAITGYTRSDIIGRSPNELDLYAVDEQRKQAIDLFVEQGHIREFEFEFRKKSGQVHHGMLWAETIELGDEKNALMLIQDITDRKRSEQERQALIDFQQIVASLSARFINLETDEIDLAIDRALQTISEYAAADACSVWMFDDTQSSASKTFGWPSNEQDEGNQNVPIDRFPWVLGTMLDNEILIVSGRADVPPEASDMHFMLDNYMMAAMLAVPLVSEGYVIGSISIYMQKTERVWADDLVSLLKIIGDIIVNALERKRAEEDIRQLNEDLERRVVQRTQQLEAANKELEAFAYSVSHDLRAPLRAVDGFSLALIEDHGDQLDENAENYLNRVRAASQHMGRIIDELLKLSRVTRSEMVHKKVDLSELITEVISELQEVEPDRNVAFEIEPGLKVLGDEYLLRIALVNLCSNAWKFTRKKEHACIEFGCLSKETPPVFFIRDNGAGFDMAYVEKMFGTFQRLHNVRDFEGTGIGLATVKRIIQRHGGRVWAEGEIDQGATFYFTLGDTLND